MKNRGHQVFWRGGFGHHRIGQANAERSLDAKQQLHTFEAADTQIPIQGIVKSGPAGTASAQFRDEAGDDVEHLVVNERAGNWLRDSHGGVSGHQRRSNRPVFSKRWMRYMDA